VLDRIRERLGDHVVHRDLDGLGQPALDVDIELDRYRRTAAQRPERRDQAPLRQDRGVNAVGDLSQLFEDAGQLLGHMRQLAFELPELRRHRPLQRTQLEPERDEPLLGAVVQITLDPPPRLIGGGDDAGA
jgi:hypothetical protein